MNRILWSLAVLVASSLAWGQAKCPKGTVRGGGMSTTGFYYPSGCYKPAKKKQCDLKFAEAMCLETSMFEMSSGWAHEMRHTFENGKCVEREIFEHVVDFGTPSEHWEDVTADEYYRATCMKVWTMDEKGNEVVTYPKPEWTECLEKP